MITLRLTAVDERRGIATVKRAIVAVAASRALNKRRSSPPPFSPPSSILPPSCLPPTSSLVPPPSSPLSRPSVLSPSALSRPRFVLFAAPSSVLPSSLAPPRVFPPSLFWVSLPSLYVSLFFGVMVCPKSCFYSVLKC